MLLALSIAAAETPPFEVLRDWNDCTLYKREKSEGRPSAMRAECTWNDIDVALLSRRLGDFTAYDELIWAIDASEVRRTEGDRSLVYQLQKIPFINDREVLLWAEAEPLERGGVLARWTTAANQPLVARKGTVRTPHNVGYWRVEPTEAGAKVVHEIEIDAGGVPLPGWLLREIQKRGFGRLLDEVHDQVATEG